MEVTRNVTHVWLPHFVEYQSEYYKIKKRKKNSGNQFSILFEILILKPRRCDEKKIFKSFDKMNFPSIIQYLD